MLQNIAENSKNNNPNNNKVVENNPKTPQKVSAKMMSEPSDKRDLVVKSVTNVDKLVSEAAIKEQQTSVVNTHRNVPPFLLTFEIFNRNVHNCMVYLRASSNIMPWSVCQKINAKVQSSSLKIIQLYRTSVKVIGELKNVLIRLSSNLKVHQVIDIIVVDIPEVYGFFLSRD
jgi:ribonuclease HI